MGGKILDKLLINRIYYHLYKNDLLSERQSDFTPQRNTIDAAMEAKSFIQPILENRGLVIMTSLDVQKAFDFCIVASDPSRSERRQLSKKSVHSQQVILQQQKSSHKQKKLHHRKTYNKGMPARILLRTRILEHTT